MESLYPIKIYNWLYRTADLTMHIWSNILGLLLTLRWGLLMRGVRGEGWGVRGEGVAVVNKIIFYAVGSRRLTLRSQTRNTLSDCEVDDEISFNFIVNSGILDLSSGLETLMIIMVQLLEREIFFKLIS